MNKLSLIITAGALLMAGSAFAGDPAAGEGTYKGKGCIGCHGPAGESANPMYPKLKGQFATYAVKQLKAFKDGTRKEPTMSAMAAMLSDADIANVSAYLEAQK